MLGCDQRAPGLSGCGREGDFGGAMMEQVVLRKKRWDGPNTKTKL